MTHKDLVRMAAAILKKRWNYSVVVCEPKGYKESPDALGMNAYDSTLIECKATRSDFLRDKDKPHRKDGGIGNWRYYLCPRGVISAEELPPKWGLIYASARGASFVVNPKSIKNRSQCQFSTDYEGERKFLYQIAWKYNNEIGV